MQLSPESSAAYSPYQYDSSQRKCTIRNAEELPREIFGIADDIEILDASFGHLSSLPDNLGDLKNLRVAFFSHNDFDDIPRVLSSCANLEMVGFKSCKIDSFDAEALPGNLRGLILTDNRLKELPEAIGSYTQLQKLMLTGNQISNFPKSILECVNLELMRVSINQLQESPDWIFQLPRLAWYGDSQNPFRKENLAIPNVSKFSWSDLDIRDVLGKSAKNVVYEAELAGRQVAIKLFGSGITTDGMPEDDMNISLLAGDHPNIISGIGKVVSGPDNQEGLMMPLIPAEYKTLASPPDFTTLTRDVYPETTTFTEPFIRQVLLDISSAMTHLSGRGIMHGDIYAHNILTNQNGQSYLGDFGASSLYNPGSTSGNPREHIEVRGFGCLIDDLLTHSSAPALDLCKLRDDCLRLDPGSRPTFKDIGSALGR